MDVAARGPGLTGLATGAVHPRERRYGSSAITPNKHPHARETPTLEQDDMGRSISKDRETEAGNESRKGQGDRGDQRR